MPAILSRRDEVRALRLARSQPESLVEFNVLVEALKGRVTEAALADRRLRARLKDVR